MVVRPGVSAIIVTGEGLLLQRRGDNGLWGLPGGSVEPGESVADAVVREVREETGLELEPLDFLGHRLEPYDGRIVLCLTWTARAHGDARAADDLSKVRWLAPSELPPPDELAFTHYPDVLRAAVGYEHP